MCLVADLPDFAFDDFDYSEESAFQPDPDPTTSTTPRTTINFRNFSDFEKDFNFDRIPKRERQSFLNRLFNFIWDLISGICGIIFIYFDQFSFSQFNLYCFQMFYQATTIIYSIYFVPNGMN